MSLERIVLPGANEAALRQAAAVHGGLALFLSTDSLETNQSDTATGLESCADAILGRFSRMLLEVDPDAPTCSLFALVELRKLFLVDRIVLQYESQYDGLFSEQSCEGVVVLPPSADLTLQGSEVLTMRIEGFGTISLRTDSPAFASERYSSLAGDCIAVLSTWLRTVHVEALQRRIRVLEFALDRSEHGLKVVQNEVETVYKNTKYQAFEFLKTSAGDCVVDLASAEPQLASLQDGSARWLSVETLGLGSDGSGALTIIRDHTQQKQLELSLIQAQKMEAVGRLASGVAHDFNNLLTAVLGYSGLLLSRMIPNDPNRNEVVQIRKASEQAGRLIEQLLTFSRKRQTQAVVSDLNSIVEDTSRMLRRLIGEDIELEVELAESIRPVCIDPGQVQQVLLNLAINARDAMPNGGSLLITTAAIVVARRDVRHFGGIAEGSYSAIQVSDTGCGLTDEVKAHLFEPFFTTKEQGKGTGLGLSTVYGIVKQAGGYIAVTSEVGKGSSFQVLLPEGERIHRPSELEHRLEIVTHGSETVLLVEDDASVRGILREVLEGTGYLVLEAENGVEAVRVSERFPGFIHLLVTDMVMPIMGGSETIAELRRRRPYIKTLVISGYAHNLQAEGDGAFLSKPFSPSDFLELVRGTLDMEPESTPAPFQPPTLHDPQRKL